MRYCYYWGVCYEFQVGNDVDHVRPLFYFKVAPENIYNQAFKKDFTSGSVRQWPLCFRSAILLLSIFIQYITL